MKKYYFWSMNSFNQNEGNNIYDYDDKTILAGQLCDILRALYILIYISL